MRSVALIMGFALGAVGSAASAQIQQLPETSRSEAQVNSLNRSMMQQQQGRAVSQQNQFDTNSLHSEIRAAPVLPQPVMPVGPGAPPARIGR